MLPAVFVFLAVMALGLAFGPSDQPSDQANLQYAKAEEHGTEAVPLVVKIVPAESTPQSEKREKDKNEQDRRLADYTEFLFFATLFLGAATAGLAVVAYRQMREARDSIEATKTLAGATVAHAGHAERAIEVAEQSAERELRAYVFAKATQVSIEMGTDPTITIEYNITNFGRTPAYDIRNVAEIRLMPSPLPADYVLESPNIENAAGTGALAPNDPILNIATRKYEGSRDKQYYLLVFITYFDAFKRQQRTTKFCCYADLPGLFARSIPGGRPVPIEDVRFHITRQHNEAD